MGVGLTLFTDVIHDLDQREDLPSLSGDDGSGRPRGVSSLPAASPAMAELHLVH